MALGFCDVEGRGLCGCVFGLLLVSKLSMVGFVFPCGALTDLSDGCLACGYEGYLYDDISDYCITPSIISEVTSPQALRYSNCVLNFL